LRRRRDAVADIDDRTIRARVFAQRIAAVRETDAPNERHRSDRHRRLAGNRRCLAKRNALKVAAVRAARLELERFVLRRDIFGSTARRALNLRSDSAACARTCGSASALAARSMSRVAITVRVVRGIAPLSIAMSTR